MIRTSPNEMKGQFFQVSSVFLTQPLVILKIITCNIMQNKDLFVLGKVSSLLKLLTVSVIKHCFQITITSNLITALVKQCEKLHLCTWSRSKGVRFHL